MKRNPQARRHVINSNKYPKVSNNQQFRWQERCERKRKEHEDKFALQIMKIDISDIDLTSVLEDMNRKSEPMVVSLPDINPMDINLLDNDLNISIILTIPQEDRIKVEEFCSKRSNLRMQDITEIASQVLCERDFKELESCKKLLLKITCY